MNISKKKQSLSQWLRQHDIMLYNIIIEYMIEGLNKYINIEFINREL